MRVTTRVLLVPYQPLANARRAARSGLAAELGTWLIGSLQGFLDLRCLLLGRWTFALRVGGQRQIF